MNKKKILLSVVIAVILVMAISVTAFAADVPTVNSSSNAPKSGDKITFTITVPGEGMQANVSASDNLKYEESKGAISSNESAFAALNVGVIGGSSVTYTYVVTGEAGEEYSFTLSSIVLADGSKGADITVSGKIAETSVPSDPTDPDQPVDPDQPADPDTPAQGGDTQDKGELDDVPKTGDASQDMWIYAVMALAAAGVIGAVAFKKAFSK